ncbi:MAG: hypothetical protein WBV82_30030, partial [Myxococcaceae bacterium]
MNKAVLLLCASALALSGCYGGNTPEIDDTQPSWAPPRQTATADGQQGPSGTAKALPADVQAVVATCSGCHGTSPTGGVRLRTYEDLVAKSPTAPSMLVIDRMIARMTDAARPMPPGALPPSTDVDVLVAWRAAGMPAAEGDPAQPAPAEPNPQAQPQPQTPPDPSGTAKALPADVQAVVATCSGCHGTSPTGGVRLRTYEDLVANSPTYPSMLVIDRMIARMTDAARPMPPGALPPSSDVDVLAAW